MAGPSAGDSQVSFEMAHKSLMYHALSKSAGNDSQAMSPTSARHQSFCRTVEQRRNLLAGRGCLRGRNTTLLLHDRLAAVTLISLEGDREETMARQGSEL